jgi:hypothetical protein
VGESTRFQVNSTTHRIVIETHQRASDAIANGETEGAELLVWWERLAGLNQGMSEKMVGGAMIEESF